MFRYLRLVFWGGIVLAIAAVAVMLLWNVLLPSVLGLGLINYWQALGLLVLCRILFGGFRWGGRRHHFSDNPIHEKWKNMTREERKEFIEKRRKFGFGGPLGRGRFNMGDFADETQDKQ